MFTGIVEYFGKIIELKPSINGVEIVLAPNFDCKNIVLGESIAVNGVCLTVSKIKNGYLQFDAVSETLKKTTLSKLQTQQMVNLERALCIGDRLSGHFVTGHVDGIGNISQIIPTDNNYWITITTPNRLLPMIAPKGSITIDGMSITVVDVQDEAFTVTLIPHTLKHTIANAYAIGHSVNLEVDILARYAQRFFNQEKI